MCDPHFMSKKMRLVGKFSNRIHVNVNRKVCRRTPPPPRKQNSLGTLWFSPLLRNHKICSSAMTHF